MSGSPYAIRKGFEFQDLVCCVEILDLLLNGNLDVEFEIESTEVASIDDLVVYPSPSQVIGHQVKYHVSAEENESFESLTKRKKTNSTSIIEKLYQGWLTLRATGRSSVQIVFTSSSYPEKGRFNLGPVISSQNYKFAEKFFSHKDYDQARQKVLDRLKITLPELREFLGSVAWRLGGRSIETLRGRVSQLLRHLKLPSDDDATSRIVELIGQLATEAKSKIRVRDFVKRLWSLSRFRDICEREFAEIDFGVSQSRRANTVKVAILSIESLPAFVGRKFCCIEEPFPFGSYSDGLTANDNGGHLDLNRTSWKEEYLEWHRRRITSTLETLDYFEPDILVFPRFSLPLETACEVARWCRTHKCHLVPGGHSFPAAEMDRKRYEAELSISVELPDEPHVDASEVVIDPVIRHDRAGRYALSTADSPFSKNEVTSISPEFVELYLADGWLTVLVLSSQQAVQRHAQTGAARPELLLSPVSIRFNELCEEVAANAHHIGVPFVGAPRETNYRPVVAITGHGEPQCRPDDGWEGVRLATIAYERSAIGWSATITQDVFRPIAYHTGEPSELASAPERLRGLSGSRSEAIAFSQGPGDGAAIILNEESPPEFYLRRAEQAHTAIRTALTVATPPQLMVFAKVISTVGDAIKRFRSAALVSPEYAAPPQVLLQHRVLPFFDRSSEKRTIGTFLSGTGGKRVLLLHGQSGVGKRALVSEVQRVSADKRSWRRFTCPPGARLIEAVSQLLVQLGDSGAITEPLGLDLYHRLTSAITACGATTVVLEDSHNLPISDNREDHVELLGLLAYICSEAGPKARLVMLSDWRGTLNFANSHRMEAVYINGLPDEYILEMLQEQLLLNPSRFEQPSVDELLNLAGKLHGNPYFAMLAANAMQESSAADVAGRLYGHVKTQEFVAKRLMSGISLSDTERRLLEFASLQRIAVPSTAFREWGGPRTNSLLRQLVDRFLMLFESGKYLLHPILRSYFEFNIESADVRHRLHNEAYVYYLTAREQRSLSVEEMSEYIYHATAAGKMIDLSDMKMFAGSMRKAINDGIRSRDWVVVENAGRQLLEMLPQDVYGQVGVAIALDATGREYEAEQYVSALYQVSDETLWIALEFVRSLLRRKDFDSAERNLAVLQQQFPNNAKVVIVRAQLENSRGNGEKSIESCEHILSRTNAKDGDLFMACLLLRDAGRFDIIWKHLEHRYLAAQIDHPGLLRMYFLSLVKTENDPDVGLDELGAMWSAASDDGFVVADYAEALIHATRTSDAHRVLERGIAEVSKTSNGYRSVLEADAHLYESQERYLEAFDRYRGAIQRFKNHLHLQRRFANCLLAGAASYKSARDSASEDAAVEEAKRVLGRILEVAPLDRVAAEQMHRVEMRTY